MKKLESTLVNMVGVLVCVALVMGAILAYVNHITEGPISEQAEKALSDGIKAVMMSDNLTVTANDTISETIDNKECVFIVHKAADASGKELGAAVESTTLGFGGDLKVLVGFSPEGEILGYTLLQHAETPGLGAKADTWFQKDGKASIIGKNPSTPLTVSKDGGDVDAITASTITSRAFLKAVNQAYDVYMNKKTDAQTGATKKVALKQ
jgi:electron transport complex protein RnfG